jgi:hypothetical protein
MRSGRLLHRRTRSIAGLCRARRVGLLAAHVRTEDADLPNRISPAQIRLHAPQLCDAAVALTSDKTQP